MISFEHVENQFKEFEDGKSDLSREQLAEEIDYMIIEENKNPQRVRELRAMKKALEAEGPERLQFQSKKELFQFQKKMLRDCEQIGLDTGEELTRQQEVLKQSEQKVFALNGKLLTSSGLVQTVQNNFKRNKLICRFATALIFFVFLILILTKIF